MIEVDSRLVEPKGREVWREGGSAGYGEPVDDGKHAFGVIGVDLSLLEAKGREVWREGGAGVHGTPADLQAGGVWVAPVHLFGHPSDSLCPRTSF